MNNYKKVIIKVLAAAIVLGTCVGTAFAVAQQQQITAILDSGIKIVYGGVERTMRDANDNVVYPIVYNGTTYVPIRAVSNMLEIPVDWKSDTRTVLLGEQNVPLTDTPSIPVTSSGVSLLDAGKWKSKYGVESIIGAGNMPQDGSRTFDKGIRGYQRMQLTSGVFTLDQLYNTLSFTLYFKIPPERSNITFEFNIKDEETGIIVCTKSIDVSDHIFMEVSNVNISGIKQLYFTATHNGPVLMLYDMFILDPIVK